jgi:hypothetical protein
MDDVAWPRSTITGGRVDELTEPVRHRLYPRCGCETSIGQ